MARPRKQGMEYFPHDCDARNDLKVRKLRALYGNDGYAVYFILLENIYKEKLYELEILDGETLLILAEECKVTIDQFNVILNKCLELGLFDKQIYEERKVITSNAIKIRTEPIELERERKRNYRNNTSNNEVIDDKTTGQSAQSKVKERKEKESKSKEKEKDKVSEAETHSLAIELCNYYSQLKPGESIMAQISTLTIWIEDYGYDWSKEAIQMCVKKKNKFIIPWIETVLKSWQSEGKEEQHGNTGGNNTESQGKYTGFKPPPPKRDENVDTSDVI